MSLGSDFRADNAYEIDRGLPTGIGIPFSKSKERLNPDKMSVFRGIHKGNIERLKNPIKGDTIFKNGNELHVDNVFDNLVLFRVFYACNSVELKKLSLKEWGEALENEMNKLI